MMSSLPLIADPIKEILLKLDIKDLHNACQTNKQFFEICKDPYFRKEYDKIWGLNIRKKYAYNPNRGLRRSAQYGYKNLIQYFLNSASNQYELYTGLIEGKQFDLLDRYLSKEIKDLKKYLSDNGATNDDLQKLFSGEIFITYFVDSIHLTRPFRIKNLATVEKKILSIRNAIAMGSGISLNLEEILELENKYPIFLKDITDEENIYKHAIFYGNDELIIQLLDRIEPSKLDDIIPFLLDTGLIYNKVDIYPKFKNIIDAYQLDKKSINLGLFDKQLLEEIYNESPIYQYIIDENWSQINDYMRDEIMDKRAAARYAALFAIVYLDFPLYALQQLLPYVDPEFIVEDYISYVYEHGDYNSIKYINTLIQLNNHNY